MLRQRILSISDGSGNVLFFVAEYFDGHRRIEEFNNKELTFKLVDGRATYKIVVTDKWISVFRQKEK